jgi:hypothetical protein
MPGAHIDKRSDKTPDAVLEQEERLRRAREGKSPNAVDLPGPPPDEDGAVNRPSETSSVKDSPADFKPENGPVPKRRTEPPRKENPSREELRNFSEEYFKTFDTETVLIETEVMDFPLRAYRVDITEYMVFCIMPKEEQHRPKMGMDYSLRYRGESYDTIYGGCRLENEELPFTIIGFLLKKEDNEQADD